LLHWLGKFGGEKTTVLVINYKRNKMLGFVFMFILWII